MKEIVIFIPARAITKYNGRMVSRRGIVYLRPEVKTFEMICRDHARKSFEGDPLKGKLRVDIEFYFNDNKMPDLFNLPKAVCDAFNKIVWEDDRQIVQGTLKKINDGQNRIFVRVSPVDELDHEGKINS